MTLGPNTRVRTVIGSTLIIAMTLLATTAPAAQPTWIRTGGPLGGLGYDVRIRPDNVDVMYVTDAYAGVFTSTDAGETWSPANEGITVRVGMSGDAIPIFCLTIDPNDHNILWAGTQDKRGIFRSLNGGATWTQMNNGVVEETGITFRGFTIEPGNSDVIYAAAEIGSWVWAGEERTGREFGMTEGVVYKTTDGGQNWQEVWRGDNLARYVWIDPRDVDVVYVSTGIFDREAANSDPNAANKSDGAGGVGILKSTDGGQTWNTINNGLENLYVGTLFMHPENPDILLAGTGNNQYREGSGVYISTDAGNSWQRTLDDEAHSVEFAVSNPQIAYAGNPSAVYRSEDGGTTWERVAGVEEGAGWGPPGVRAGFPIDFEVAPNDPNRIFANNYGGGNFLSVDGGRTWSVASQGYTGAQVRDIAVDPEVPGRVFAAARSGLFGSSDGGGVWVGRSYAPAAVLEWYVVAFDPTNPQRVLAANNWNGPMVESLDNGRHWREVAASPAANMSWRAIVFAPSEPTTAYAGVSAFFSAGTFDDAMAAGGIYVSYDGGETWNESNDATSRDANVAALAIEPGNPRVVFAATGNSGILKTTDGGQSWTAINNGLPASPAAASIVVRPDAPEIVFAGLILAGVYRSEDGGATWQSSSTGMNPGAFVSDIVMDPTNPQVMYCTDRLSGVYRSTDSGVTWSAMSEDLTTGDVNALALSSDGLHLYAASEGGGVFRLDLEGNPPPGTEWPEEEEEHGDGDEPDGEEPDGDDPGDTEVDEPDGEGPNGEEPDVDEPDDTDVDEPVDDEPASGGGGRRGGICGPGMILLFACVPVMALWKSRRRN